MRGRPVISLKRLSVLATATVLAAVGVGVTAAPASAGPIGPCTSLRSFNLEFRTGGDDLRGNSEVIVWLRTTSGTMELQHVWGRFADHTSTSRLVTFQNPNWAVNSCTITGVSVRMASHPEWHETADNWNMDGFALQGYSSTGAYGYSLSRNSANKRFTAGSPWWHAAE